MTADSQQQTPCELQPGETLDDLRLGGLKIIQHQDGYRFSLDPVLLCAFTRVAAGETVVDLGSGSGVIPLLMARRSDSAQIIGVERQSTMVDRSRRSVLLNGLESRITIQEGDLRQIRNLLDAESAQVVVANPPFRKVDSGRLSPHSERAQARHEVAGNLADFVAAAAYLLGSGGRCYLVYLAERLAELLDLLRQAGLEPKRLRCIHSRTGQAARMVLVESRRAGGVGLTIEAPLYVYDGECYSAEVLGCYGEG
ncbi:MAG: tRNA1(Val) (adenine(37)-N6)-methyltransferase [Desulfuromonadaceae bacterium]|nr:tRNA1(Val) (adenine(37)-N6)-methyltransferase [Desulfuromonadaceae bacterium]